MASDLLLPGGMRPSNLHLRADITARYVEADVCDICNRVKEVDPSLHVVQLEDGDDCAYAIMEHCDDGLERLVFRVKELDARVIEKLQYLMHMPLEERIAKLEREEYQWEADREEALHEKLYETLGRPMLTELERCGFIQRPISYPKTGVTGGRGSRARST